MVKRIVGLGAAIALSGLAAMAARIEIGPVTAHVLKDANPAAWNGAGEITNPVVPEPRYI